MPGQPQAMPAAHKGTRMVIETHVNMPVEHMPSCVDALDTIYRRCVRMHLAPIRSTTAGPMGGKPPDPWDVCEYLGLGDYCVRVVAILVFVLCI